MEFYRNSLHSSFFSSFLSKHFFTFVTGNTAPMRGYIAAATYMSERTTHMAILSAFQSVGFTIGPVIQAALTPLKCADLADSQTVVFDMFTVAG